MGERGARNEPATADDIAAMARLVREAMDAGAFGFSSSRTIGHRAIDGEPVPGTFARRDELFGIGAALAAAGHGVFEVAEAGVGGMAAGDGAGAAVAEMAWMEELARAIKRPVSFLLLQNDNAPDEWRELLALSDAAARRGANLVPQVASRPFGMLAGHQSRVNPFAARPTYLELARLPLAERVHALRDPDVRARILAERAAKGATGIATLLGPRMYPRLFPLGVPVDYEPTRDASVTAIAARDVEDVLYELMLRHDGRELLFFPLLNYSEFSGEPIREMMLHPKSVLGLGDGGAHCGIICDASMTTYVLSHWVRDRTRGPRIPLEAAVKRLTHDTAELYGFTDRGVVRPGMKADLNVIDLDRVQLELPEMAFDLPAGAPRLLQRATGYVATVVAGEVILRDGEPTGARPGKLVRSRPAALAPL